MAVKEIAPGLAVGPMEVDGASELVGELGVHNKAAQLLDHHAKLYPTDLRQQLALPRDPLRSEALDLEEVEEALHSLSGRRAFFKEGYVLEDASVKGTRPRDRVVSVVYRLPGPDRAAEDSGRSARGTFPYSLVEADTEPRYEELLAAQKAKEGHGVSEDVRALVEALVSGRTGEGSSGGSQDTGAVDELRKEVEALRKQQRDAEQRAVTAEEERDRARDPEPWDGYDDLNADDVISDLSDGAKEQYGVAGLERIATYEETHKNRKSVLAAIEAAKVGGSAE